ncbi:HEXXH motif domain-containing protein [Streptomyces sp. NPDC003635]
MRAERSRRLLLLRLLDDTVDLGSAWDLLSEAQQSAPSVVDEVLIYPQTGMWLAGLLRRLRGSATPHDPPLWVEHGYFSALAAAAGLRAGLDFTIDVPVRHGWVPLPTLGCAAVPVVEPWSRATVRSGEGRAVVEAAGARVDVPLTLGARGPGWHPVRRVTVGPAKHRLELALDDVDPYRTYPLATEPRPLSDSAAAQWGRLLELAWAVLLREQPDTAEAMRRGLFSLSPTRARERFRPRSVTSGDAFGGIQASLPDDAVQLAVTLVHEFQHTKLGGLLHLKPLLQPGEEPDGKELWYAPWRDDPRPLGGLLQGIYAFTGITRFWRTHRKADSSRDAMAHFEFALWRLHVVKAIEQIHLHPRLTELGATVIDILRKRCALWLDEPVPEEPLALARMCAADHATRWRAHHLQPPVRAVDETVQAWLDGADGPPVSLAAKPTIASDPSARWLDSLAMLVRHRLDTVDGEQPHLDVPGQTSARVAGALAGDALLATGDASAARDAYVAHLRRQPAHAGAWAGLGRALEIEGVHPAAALLCHRPEQARAVAQALAQSSGRSLDPLALVTWLASPPKGTSTAVCN